MSDNKQSKEGREAIFKQLIQIPEEGRHRNVPSLKLIEDVSTLKDHQIVGKQLSELYSKYKFMELNLRASRRSLLSQSDELLTSKKAIKKLFDKQTNNKESKIQSYFKLNDTVYAKAEIDLFKDNKPTNVLLWLGANVAVEYPIPEAIATLDQNLATVSSAIKELEEDLDYVREQMTVAEILISRLHNYNVHLNQQKSVPTAVAS